MEIQILKNLVIEDCNFVKVNPPFTKEIFK